jgi:transposase
LASSRWRTPPAGLTWRIGWIARCVLCLPAGFRLLPCGLNPIEQAFAKLKAALRNGAARTVKALLKPIGKRSKSFAPEECANYFRHAGYE